MRNKLLLIAVLLGGLSSLWAQENKLMNAGFEEGTVKTKRGGVENGEWYKNNLPNSSIMPVVMLRMKEINLYDLFVMIGSILVIKIL